MACIESVQGCAFSFNDTVEWLRHFDGLAVGETAAPAWFLRENAEEAGMPPLLSYRNDRGHEDTRVKRKSTPLNIYICIKKSPDPQLDENFET